MPSIKSKQVLRPWAPVKDAQTGRGADDDFDYNSTRWRKDRLAHLSVSENPLCVLCLETGKAVEATVSDHIKPIRQGGSAWDWDNRQALCVGCHARKSGREAHSRRRGGVGGY